MPKCVPAHTHTHPRSIEHHVKLSVELTGRFLFENIIWHVCVIHILTSLLNVCSIRGYICLFSSTSCIRLYRIQLYAVLTKCVWWQNNKSGLWPLCLPDL